MTLGGGDRGPCRTRTFAVGDLMEKKKIFLLYNLVYINKCVSTHLDLIRCFTPCFGEHTEHESSEQLLKELFDGDRFGGGDGGRFDLGNIPPGARCGFKLGGGLRVTGDGGVRRRKFSIGDRGERGDFRRIDCCSGGERGRRRISAGERGRLISGERRRSTGDGGERRRCIGDCGDRRLTGDTGGDFRLRDRLRLLRLRL